MAPSPISAASARPASSLTSASRRRAPSAPASSAVARPMPLAAPVISTPLSSSIPIRRLLSGARRGGELLAQRLLVDLPGRGLGELVDDLPARRDLEGREALS